MSKQLVRSGAIVSAMTLISRVMGLVRDVVVANLMGAGSGADVFFFANKIPNFLRRLFAEGAFAQAFVPVLSETHNQQGMDGTRQLIARVSGTLGTLVMGVTLFGVLASPLVAALFGTGWFIEWWQGGEAGAKFELASALLKITFPYLFFVALTALSGAVLNTLGKFAVAAFTPVLLNVAIISAAICLSPFFDNDSYALAWGVFIGGVVQLLFQLPFLYRAGVLVKPQWGWHDPGVVRIRTLMIPALFGVSVSQINLLFDTLIASFLQTGSISWLYYSDRLLEFPLGLFGIAIATVILPSLSTKHVNKGRKAFADTLDWAVRTVSLLGIPASLGLAVLAQPLLIVLFMRGEFDLQDSQMAAASLMAYSAGLLSFMLIKVLAPGYFARQDTKTPVKYGIVAMIANMGFNLVLALQYNYVGLAMATALSGTLNAVLLYVGLRKLGVFRLSRQSVTILLRQLLAGIVMALVLMQISPAISAWAAFDFLTRCYWLFGLVVVAMLVYLFGLLLLGIRPGHFRIQEADSE